MRNLHMIFHTEDGKTATIIPKGARGDLSVAEVKAAMEQLVKLKLFEKAGVQLYTGRDSAKYVDIIETELF